MLRAERKLEVVSRVKFICERVASLDCVVVFVGVDSSRSCLSACNDEKSGVERIFLALAAKLDPRGWPSRSVGLEAVCFARGVPNDNFRGVLKNVGLSAPGSAVFQVTRGS